MALSEEALRSLAGLWGGYDFYLIRDRHFKTAPDMVERFLHHFEHRWNGSLRPIDVELGKHPKQIRKLITEWAEKKLELVTENDSVQTLQSNIMFKQLLYGQGPSISGRLGQTGGKKSTSLTNLRCTNPGQSLMPRQSEAERKNFDAIWSPSSRPPVHRRRKRFSRVGGS
jgi:hypothetical protein